MPRLRILLLLAVSGLTPYVEGQEPFAAVLAAPPVVGTDSVPLSSPEVADYFNSYPDDRCEEWGCCNQWWCATWYARIEMLALIRDHDPQQRVVVQTTGGTPVFRTDDIDFELSPGISTLLGHRLNGMSAFEFSYSGANQWNEERTVSGAGDLRFPGTLSLLEAYDGAFAMEISLRSQMHNAEVNYLRDIQNVSLLAGFRYFNWQEQLAIEVIDSDLEANDYSIQLSNNLVGGQIGARVTRYFYGLEIDATSKVGIFGNQATEYQRVTILNGTTIFQDFTRTEGVVAFLGDLNLSANCPLTSVWRLRAGYNLIFVTNLALAANQLDFAFNAVRTHRVRQDADVFLHGFNVGLEAIW